MSTRLRPGVDAARRRARRLRRHRRRARALRGSRRRPTTTSPRRRGPPIAPRRSARRLGRLRRDRLAAPPLEPARHRARSAGAPSATTWPARDHAAERAAAAARREIPQPSSCSNSCTSRSAMSPRPPRRSAASSCSPATPPRARALATPRQAVPRLARPRRRGVSLPQGGARLCARRSGDRVPAADGGDGAR